MAGELDNECTDKVTINLNCYEKIFIFVMVIFVPLILIGAGCISFEVEGGGKRQ